MRKLLSFLLVLTLSLSLLSGVALAATELTYNAVSDANSYDPRDSIGLDQRTVISQCFEPLVKYDAEGQIIPGAAESWTVSEDGKVITFIIRDHVWSDGEPVKASDFVFAFQTAVDPENASKSATAYSVILNADAIIKGEMQPSELGIVAIDEKTLEITLHTANPFALHTMAGVAFAPVPAHVPDVEHLNDWTLEPKTYISNGPFKMISWEPKAKMVFEKNPLYYAADDVKLDKLTYVFVSDANTALAGFKKGDIDVLTTVPASEILPMLADGLLTINPWAATYYYSLNQNGMNTITDPAVLAALGNKDVRHALNLAIDRTLIVEQVTRGGQTAAYGFVPGGVVSEEGDFRAQKSYFDPKGDVTQAQALLAQAGYPGGAGFPVLEIFYNTDDTHKLVAEAIQEMWRKNLGINVTLSNKETAVFAAERAEGKAQIARCGNTSAIYAPAILGLFTAGNLASGNEAKWVNVEYDRLYALTQSLTDAKEIIEVYHQMEDLLMDEMVVIPLYFYARQMAVQKDIHGIIREGSGLIRFQDTYRD